LLYTEFDIGGVMSETFGDVLKRVRTEKGLSQRQVAIKYGLLQGKEHGATTSLVAAWEYSTRKPSRKSIGLLSDALKLTSAERAELLMAAGFLPEESADALERVQLDLRADGRFDERAISQIMEFVSDFVKKQDEEKRNNTSIS